MKISFYPGPSRVHDEIPEYTKEAFKAGILSMNHRSPEFVALVKKTVTLLKAKLKIPATYSIFFTSSATECWEIIAQSIIRKESAHLFSGAFGEKWYDYTARLVPRARAIPFDREKLMRPVPFGKSDVICITQNETSNGTQISNKLIGQLKNKNPGKLIAVDATSSMAGIYLDFRVADIWFASVQKCFGLPAGLSLLICSPRAMLQVKKRNEKRHYNSMTFMNEMMNQWQTPFTPNVLGIYLLMRVMKKAPVIQKTEKKIQKRYKAWQDFFQASTKLNWLIKNREVRSKTVLAIQGDEAFLKGLKLKAKQNKFLLGEGYGKLKQSTFRIANFPALKGREIRKLMGFLRGYL